VASSYPVTQVLSRTNESVVSPSWTPPSRAEQFKRLEDDHFDVLVIGGGAVGSGVAMDAASRGLKVALVEREDFASGTSSRSTKLIHGGIRYLAQCFQSKIPPQSLLEVFQNLRYEPEYMKIVSADLKVHMHTHMHTHMHMHTHAHRHTHTQTHIRTHTHTHEHPQERAFMIQSAPFMTRPIPMMIPLYYWWEVPMMAITGKMYDFIAGRRQSVPPSHFVPKAEALYQFPSLKEHDDKGNELYGCMVVYDGQQNDTRMNLHIALTAAQDGACLANHCEVQSLLSEGEVGDADAYKVTGARVKDTLSGQVIDVKARTVINACGVYSDKIRQMADPAASNIMIPGPGTHVILPDWTSPASMGLVWFTRDGRVLYLLPWEGQTIAGTTDSLGEVTFEPKPTMDEVNFIVSECNRVLKDKISTKTVRAAWSGLRPLVRDPNADPSDTKKLSRDHVVDVVAGNLVTIAGGKWTTYRKMAEDAVDKALLLNPELAQRAKPCVTPTIKLIGADRGMLVCHQDFHKVAIMLREQFHMDKDTAEHLCHNYGTRALQLAAMALEDKRKGKTGGDASLDGFAWTRLVPQHPALEAEVLFAVRHEYAESAVDVLARRTRLSFVDIKAALTCLPRVLDLMQGEMGWDAARREQEEAEALRFFDTMYLPAGPSDPKELKDRLLY
jgi:glycerol-3-phosphate dehydrogenase